jgi:hypothetical protein
MDYRRYRNQVIKLGSIEVNIIVILLLSLSNL